MVGREVGLAKIGFSTCRPTPALFFQSIQQTPKTGAAFPVRVRVAGVESGFRLHVLRKFGGAGFLTLSSPILFVEMQHTTVNVENPALSASQQKQNESGLSFTTVDRLGLEFGGGFYLQQKKK